MRKLFTVGLAVSAGLGTMLVFAPATAHAQGAAGQKPIPPITLDLRDAPIKDALTQLFNTANVDFSLDPAVQGYIPALKITEQPFEGALRLLLRTAQPPLTFTRENGVYIVRPRRAVDPTANAGDVPPDLDPNATPAGSKNVPEKIYLTYVGPEIAEALGGSVLRLAQSNNQQGGGGGGFGGGGLGGGFGGGGQGGGGGGFGGGGLGGGGGGFGGGGQGGGGGGFGGGGLGGGGGGFGGGGLGGGGGGLGGGGGGFGGGGGGGFGGGGGGFGR